MSFRDCIQNWSDIGRLSEKKREEAFGTFDRAYERAVADGLDGVAAEAHAAGKALEEITTLTSTRRWQRINEMQRSYELHSRIMRSNTPWRELEHIVAEMESTYDSVRGIAMATMDSFLSKYKPQKGGLSITTAGLDDIVHGVYGDVRTPVAKEMGDAIVHAMETLRKWANMHGASIPENPNRKLFQTHDAVKVKAVSEDQWVSEHLADGVLDWDVMRYAGKKIDPEAREGILRKTYEGIITDGFIREKVGQQAIPNLAGRLNRDRFLYYASPDSYIKMQEKYGAGNFFEQTVGMIDAMAKDISILRTFGPSADSMKEFAKRVGLERASKLDVEAVPGKRTNLDKMKREVVVFDDEYRIHARHVPATDGNWAVNTFATVRTLAVNALLGGVFIPSLYGDMANAKVAARMFNLPEAKVFGSYIDEFVPSPEKTAEAVRGGVVFENAISLAFSRQRYFGALDGPHWARRLSDITYRMGLAAHHTQVARNSQGKMFMGVLADHAGKQFDELPFAAAMVEQGITAAEWNAFRAIPLHEVRGATFLRPIDMWNGAADDVGRKAAEKFSNLMQIYIRTAVPDVTLRARRALGAAVDPNSASGQLFRTVGSLMSFPVSIYFNQLRRIVETPGVRNKAVLAARYFAWMTLGGMMITQTRALVAGKNPHSMMPYDDEGNFNWDFYGRSVINGGSFGILGDLVFNNININNSQYRSGNPTLEYLKSAHKLTIDNLIDAMQGRPTDAGKDTLDFARANVPNLWYTKLLFDRALGDELMQQTDPAGYKMKKKYLQEHEEGMWWEPD